MFRRKTATDKPKIQFGGVSEKCVLCGKSVYPAERTASTTGNIFHKNCFRCTSCNKLLTPNIAFEHSTTHRMYCKTHLPAGRRRIRPVGRSVFPSPLHWRDRLQFGHAGAAAEGEKGGEGGGA